MKKHPFNDGDIVLLKDGRVLRILDARPEYSDQSSMVQFVDKNDICFIDFRINKIDHNFGDDKTALFNYLTSRSIHLRLNRLAEV